MNSSWDPYSQTFNLTRTDGGTITVALDFVNGFNIQNVKWATIFAVQIGGAGVLLIILSILAKPSQRLAIFYLNLVSLALVIARGALAIEYIIGPWNNAYRYFTMDFSTIPSSSTAKSISQAFLQLAMIICIMSSLVLQMRAAYEQDLFIQRVATAVSGTMAVVVLGFYIKVLQENISTILNAGSYDSTTHDNARLLFTLAICVFTLFFLAKLAKAIIGRQRMKMKGFGPLQIVFVMGCQCMLFPCLFCVLGRVLDFDGMSSFTVFFVVISLPLSSLWAASDKKNINAQHQQQQSLTRPSYFPQSYRSKMSTMATDSSVNTDLEKGTVVRVERGYSVDCIKETP